MKKPGLFRSLQKKIGQKHRIRPDVFTHYVALGDSISTDDYPGEGKGAASLFFKNDDRTYPDFENRDLRSLYPKLELIFLAQDGATTSDVLHHQLPELLKIDPAWPLFSITAGGNDILSLEADAAEVEFRLNTILQKLTQSFPESKILLGTIYDPTDGVGDLLEPETFLQREMAILHQVNEHIRSKAGTHIEIVEIYRRFLGHGSHCKDPANPHYHVEDPSLWYFHTIEPNVRGGHEIRKLFWHALESSGAKAGPPSLELEVSGQEVLQDLLQHNISDRLLGRFSEEQVVDALKNYGVLQQLTEKGYPQPRILIRSIDPFRQSLKILSSLDAPEDDAHLLCELRLFDTWLKNPASDELPEFQFDALVIDWLLFQNPNADFSPDRPPLPGQQYPGLGIMRTSMTAILDFAKQIGKEAVVNIPEYFHNAALYWPSFRFFSPQAEGEFSCLRKLFSNISLAEASHALETGGIYNENTNSEFDWQPHEQGMGLTSRISDYFLSPEYKRKVGAAEKACGFRISKVL